MRSAMSGATPGKSEVPAGLLVTLRESSLHTRVVQHLNYFRLGSKNHEPSLVSGNLKSINYYQPMFWKCTKSAPIEFARFVRSCQDMRLLSDSSSSAGVPISCSTFLLSRPDKHPGWLLSVAKNPSQAQGNPSFHARVHLRTRGLEGDILQNTTLGVQGARMRYTVEWTQTLRVTKGERS